MITTNDSIVDRHPIGSAVVVGASLSGLMTALTLARVGVSVTLLERSDDTGRTGAVIQIEDGLLERITGLPSAQIPQPLAFGIQTWFTAHSALLTAAEAHPLIAVRRDTAVVRVDQDARHAWAVTVSGDRFEADALIGADGHRSVVRRHVSPENPDANFAGYVIWIGIAKEADLPTLRRTIDMAFHGGDTFTLLGTPLPGQDGSTARGHRRIGWGLYDNTQNALLRATGSVTGSVVHHSLLAEDIPDDTYNHIADLARREFPAPWRDAILDCVQRRAVIGTPIAEYVPERLVTGRIALVGDAAHVPTPMTGSGFRESLHDAEALASAVARAPETAWTDAFLDYERVRLGPARDLVNSGRNFSRAFAGRAA